MVIIRYGPGNVIMETRHSGNQVSLLTISERTFIHIVRKQQLLAGHAADWEQLLLELGQQYMTPP